MAQQSVYKKDIRAILYEAEESNQDFCAFFIYK
jgi:hypothetical protein